jgi:glycerol uptake facilitator-like aquaporin
MAEIPGILYHMIIEMLGCLILGTVVSVMKLNALQMILLPFACWIPYMICWKISNAHLNPAVTLVAMLRTDYDLTIFHGLLYMIAQFIGFFGSNFLVWWFTRDVGNLNIWKRDGNWQYSEAIGMEFFGSLFFVLVHTLQLSKDTSLSHNYGLNSLVVGGFYGALIYWSMAITGGSFNPAYGAAKTIVDSFDHGHEESVEQIWVYICFPMLAAMFIWPLYHFIYSKANMDGENRQTDVVKAKEL